MSTTANINTYMLIVLVAIQSVKSSHILVVRIVITIIGIVKVSSAVSLLTIRKLELGFRFCDLRQGSYSLSTAHQTEGTRTAASI